MLPTLPGRDRSCARGTDVVQISSCGTPALLAEFRRRAEILQERHGADTYWPWSESAARRNSYGSLTAGGVMASAHRLSYVLFVGPIPEGLLVRHSCDFRACVNPAHLSTGTKKDNIHDAMRRDRLSVGDDHYTRQHPERVARGERQHLARLTVEIVKDIRVRYAAGGVTLLSLGSQFGVTEQAIHCVVHRKTWKHVT